MIKIIVVVAGLALVEAPPNGPIDIHLPETEGFLLPAYSLKNPQLPGRVPLDDHTVDVYFGTSEISNPAPFKLEVRAAGGAGGQGDLAHFMQFEKTLPAELSRVRDDCRFRSKQSLSRCQGLAADLKTQAPLLAGQIRLSGDWTVRAMNARWPAAKKLSPVDGDGASKVRRLIDDDVHSNPYPNYPPNYVDPQSGRKSISLADAFVFEIESTSFEASGPPEIASFDTAEPAGDLEDLCGRTPAADCRVLWIENQASCRLTGGCVDVSDLFKKFDLHLSHAYRLTATYEPSSDGFAKDLFVPAGVTHAHTHTHDQAVILGDGSPRCYGGVIVP